MSKVLCIGIEGFDPILAKELINLLPNLKKIQENSIFGEIKSTIPPVSPQTWISSLSGKNPGAFGFLDYKYRGDFSYKNRNIVNSLVVNNRVNCLYNILPKLGQKVSIVDVPGLYPPINILGGYSITDCVDEKFGRDITAPVNFYKEINELFKNYVIDLKKLDDYKKSLELVHEKIKQRIVLSKYLIDKKNCDFVFVVLRGLDFIINMLNKKTYYDYSETDSNFKIDKLVKEYYIWIDKEIGDIAGMIDNDELSLLLFSPFSFKKFNGFFNINEWLIEKGYLVLNNYPNKLTPINMLDIDWAKTIAWVEHPGQLFINLEGRENNGTVMREEYDEVIQELVKRINQIPNDFNINNQIIGARPREDIISGTYSTFLPDIFIDFSEAQVNINEIVGYGKGNMSNIFIKSMIYYGNGFPGYLSLYSLSLPSNMKLNEINLLNIAPTILDLLNLEIPLEMEEASLLSLNNIKNASNKKIKNEDNNISSRLKALGY